MLSIVAVVDCQHLSSAIYMVFVAVLKMGGSDKGARRGCEGAPHRHNERGGRFVRSSVSVGVANGKPSQDPPTR
jgi:hypothetical protein